MGQSARNYMKAAEQFILNGYFEDAIEQYNKAITLDPENGKAYEERAKAYQVIEAYEKAANDFKNAAVFGVNPAENFYQAAQLLYSNNEYKEAVNTVARAIDYKANYHEAYILQCHIYIDLDNYNDAQLAAINAIDAKSTAYAHYLKGKCEHKLGNLSQAEQDLEKAIIKDKLLFEAYLELANVQLTIRKNRYALDNCNYVLSNDRNNLEALLIRSKVYYLQKEYSKAINDISKAITIDSTSSELYLQRGIYYYDFAQLQNAIFDFSAALELNMFNIEALKYRADAYERIGSKTKASSDLFLLLSLYNNPDPTENSEIEKRIFELNRESDKPAIHLKNPVLNDKLEVLIPRDAESISVSVNVEDASKLKFFKINNDTLLNYPEGTGKNEFSLLIYTKNLEFLTLSACDIYDNINTVSYIVERVETHAPRITLLNPYVGDDGIITISTDEKYLYLEGRIEDESLISSIRVDEVTASFAVNDINPRFTATLDISKKNRIKITATDIHGNNIEKEFLFRHDRHILADDSPMGKTWAILIENSQYKEFANLNSPEKDIQLMQQALMRYKFNKVIIKRNLTKREMERFFSIDLRDLIRVNKVNSLFIWFAGHGVNNNGVGYWIPSDARMDVEFSYYSVNALKASLYSYASLTHLLIVSDACETGSAFCTVMRGPIEGIACSNTQLAVKKSAQVYTSAGSGYASDNSLFTRAFANTLLNNEDDCSTINDIAKRVNLIMQSSSSQKPEFGRISGIEDELGTFFFITL